jgi:hypothetical protein
MSTAFTLVIISAATWTIWSHCNDTSCLHCAVLGRFTLSMVANKTLAIITALSIGWNAASVGVTCMLTSSAWPIIINTEVTTRNIGACFVLFAVVVSTSTLINVLALVIGESESGFTDASSSTLGQDVDHASGANDTKAWIVGAGTNAKRIGDGIAIITAWCVDASLVQGTLVVTEVCVKFTLVIVGTDHSITTSNDWL